MSTNKEDTLDFKFDDDSVFEDGWNESSWDVKDEDMEEFETTEGFEDDMGDFDGEEFEDMGEFETTEGFEDDMGDFDDDEFETTEGFEDDMEELEDMREFDDNMEDFDDIDIDKDSDWGEDIGLSEEEIEEMAIAELEEDGESLEEEGIDLNDLDNLDELEETLEEETLDEETETLDKETLDEETLDEETLDEEALEDEETETLDEETGIVEDVDLHVDDEPIRETSFISDTGAIVVQDTSDDRENGFDLIYVDIGNIAITHRIRGMKSVEGLVQSIQSTGLLKPIVVAPTATEGFYVLIDGYRRLQACARAGKLRVPCIVNNRVNTPEIPILEAMYNHALKYSIKEQIDYIDSLEKQKGIMNPSMIEYLLQMNSGDYTKLKDILEDNDDDIVSKLYEGAYDIATAFKKLEQRRKKESNEEKENKKATRVYGDTEETGADQIAGAGEEANGTQLDQESADALILNPSDLDEGIDDTSINELIEEDKKIEGFEPHKQKVGEREYVDPIIKKSVMARDNATCQCCKRGGEQYVDILDLHHIKPVSCGGVDSVENSIMLCVACHRLVHLYSTDDLHIDRALIENKYSDLTDEQKARYENEEIFEDEKRRFKRIIKLGSSIRKGIAAQGMSKDEYKKEHSNKGIGRRKPGVNAPQELT